MVRGISIVVIYLTSVFLLSTCSSNSFGSLPGKLSKPLSCTLVSELSSASPVRVIGVFTTWSLYSQIQIRRFRKVSALFNKQKVSFFLVFVDKDQRIVEDWISQYKPVFPVLYDPEFSVCDKKIKRVPSVLIFKGNKIIYSYDVIFDSKTLYSQIDDALKQ